jgi:hypothetical protein
VRVNVDILIKEGRSISPPLRPTKRGNSGFPYTVLGLGFCLRKCFYMRGPTAVEAGLVTRRRIHDSPNSSRTWSHGHYCVVLSGFTALVLVSTGLR